MRFSTVAAVSAAALASSTVAIPLFGYDTDLSTRNSDEAFLQLRTLPTQPEQGLATNGPSTKPGSSPSIPSNKHIQPGTTRKSHRTGTDKKRTKLSKAAEERHDLTTAGKEYKEAQAEYKKAETDLAGSRKAESHALGEMGLGGINNNLGAPTQSPHAITVKKSNTQKRSLDVEELIEELASRGFFDDEDELFVRDPTAHTPATPQVKTTPSPSNQHTIRPKNPSPTGDRSTGTGKTTGNPSGPKQSKPNPAAGTNLKSQPSRPVPNGKGKVLAPISKIPVKKLTPEQQGQQGLSKARTEYQSAESEYKKAEADLVNARKGEQQALNQMGFNGINNNFRRSLDIEEDLEARELYDEYDELFAREMTQDAPRDVDVEEIMEIIARGYYEDSDQYY